MYLFFILLFSLFALSGIRTLALMLLVLIVHSLTVVHSYHYASWAYINIKSRVTMTAIYSGLKYNLAAVVRVQRLVCPIRILTTNFHNCDYKQV